MVDERRCTFAVRWSESGERNEADGILLTALLIPEIIFSIKPLCYLR